MPETIQSCFRCGSSRIMRGKLCETGFRPSLKPRKFFTTGAVSIDGVACIACGHLELQISPEELIEMVGEPPSNMGA